MYISAGASSPPGWSGPWPPPACPAAPAPASAPPLTPPPAPPAPPPPAALPGTSPPPGAGAGGWSLATEGGMVENEKK